MGVPERTLCRFFWSFDEINKAHAAVKSDDAGRRAFRVTTEISTAVDDTGVELEW